MIWKLDSKPAKKKIDVLAKNEESFYHLICQVLGLINKKEFETQNIVTKAIEKTTNINVETSFFYPFRNILWILSESTKISIVDFQYSDFTTYLLLPLLLRDNVQRTICGINVEILQKYYQDFFTTSKIETLYLRDKYIIYNKLIAGEFKINETTPKEFVFGLLFALPLISGESKITFNKKITWADDIIEFVKILKYYNINIIYNSTNQTIKIPGKQNYHSKSVKLIPNYKYMTYFYIANILGADLSINNFNELNDEKIFVTLKKIKETRKSFDFTPKTRDDYNIIPFLLILMCLLNGKSNINNWIDSENERQKNYVLQIINYLNMFGALIKFNEKNIEVVGDPQLKFNIEVGKINVQFTPELVPALLLISLNYNTHSQPLTLYNFEKAIVNSDCTGINKLWIAGQELIDYDSDVTAES